MAGLATCIRKAGKALSRSDADSIREMQGDYIADGMSGTESAKKAVGDLIGMVEQEKSDIIKKVTRAGGDTRALTGELSYPKGTKPGKASKKTKTKQPLKYRLDDEVVEDLINEKPLHPVAQMYKVGISVEEQVENNPGMSPQLLNKARGMTENQFENFLGFIPRQYLADFGKKITAVKEYIREASRMDGTRNELMDEFDKVIKPWNKFIAKNPKWGRLLGTIMHESTLAEVDPSMEYKALKKPKKIKADDAYYKIDALRRKKHKILQDRFNAMPTDAQKIYTSVRDSYKTQRARVHQQLRDNISNTDVGTDVKDSMLALLRTKFEVGRVKGPYFPLTRFGEFWGVARDADGNIISFSKFNTGPEMRQWVADFKALGNGVTARGGKKMDEKSVMNHIDPSFVKKITDLTQNIGGIQGKELTDEIWQLYLRSMPEMSMRKSFIHRAGRLGFSADATRAYAYNMFHGAHQLAKLKHLPKMEGLMTKIRDQASELENTDDPDGKWASPIYKEMVKRHDFAKNPKVSPMATKATAFGFLWFLGATPSAALVNLTQNAIVAFPHLNARYGKGIDGAGHVAQLMKKAYGEYFGSTKSMADRLRGDEHKAFIEAEKSGVFGRTRGHDLAGVAEEGMTYNSKQRQFMEMASWMFHKAEESNRQITFMTAYRLAREAKMDHEQAIQAAEEDTLLSHFDYSVANRPRILQNSMAKVIFLFKQYSMHMIYRMSRDFSDGSKGTFRQVGNKLGLTENEIQDFEQEARKRLAGMLGVTALLGGMSSMPLMWGAIAIMNATMGTEDEPFDAEVAIRQYISEAFGGGETGTEAQEFIWKGSVDTVFNATLSSRISLNQLLWRSPPPQKEGDEVYYHYLGELVGPVFSVAKDVVESSKLFYEGQADRGLERLMPKAGKDLHKAFRYFNDGAQNYRQMPIIAPEAFNEWDIFLQAIGFAPARLTQQQEQNRAVKNTERFITDRKSHIMDRLFMAIRNSDPSSIKAYKLKIIAFNKSNPGMAIDVSAIFASANARNEYDMMTLGGINVNKKLFYLNQKLRFAPRYDKEGNIKK